MPNVTADELEVLIGDVNPLMIERIVATQATGAEVAEALADVEDERQFQERRAPTSPRVTEVRAILDELLADDDEVAAESYSSPA